MNKRQIFPMFIFYVITITSSIVAVILYIKYYPIESKVITENINKTVVTEKGIEDAINNVYDAVVTVNSYFGSTKVGTGSGFIYKNDNKGYILTNNHVIENANNYTVILSTGEVVDANLLGRDAYSDLAVLSIDKDKVPKVAILGDSDLATVGNTVFTVGSPMGEEYSGSVTRGIISGKDRTLEVDDVVTITSKLAELSPSLGEGSGILDIFTGGKLNFKTFGDNLVSYAKSLSSFDDVIGELETSKIESICNLTKDHLIETLEKLSTDSIDYIKVCDNSVAISSFGNNVGQFANHVSNIDTGKVTSVIMACKRLTELLETISTGTYSSDNVKNFKKALGELGKTSFDKFKNVIKQNKVDYKKIIIENNQKKVANKRYKLKKGTKMKHSLNIDVHYEKEKTKSNNRKILIEEDKTLEEKEDYEKMKDISKTYGNNNNYIFDKMTRISKALELNKRYDKEVTKNNGKLLEKKNNVKPMACINSRLMAKMLKYMNKDVKEQIISLRTCERHLNFKKED